MNFRELDSGSKMVVVATAVAFLSLFFNWIDAGIVAVNGFQQQGYLFLLLFLYPFAQAIQNKRINKTIGLICSVLSIVGIIGFMMSKTIEIFGKSINVASTGMYIFLIAGILLFWGVVKHAKKESIVSTPEN
ncbi:hypothetical protein ACFSO0_11695 [Brevibacillus sp. GCM10020057]|uniref:hypothetical protein n=1 Tax=Brevibacillus sp. GCM10020057 TaxID=3317327 RepID=UPI00364444BD